MDDFATERFDYAAEALLSSFFFAERTCAMNSRCVSRNDREEFCDSCPPNGDLQGT